MKLRLLSILLLCALVAACGIAAPAATPTAPATETPLSPTPTQTLSPTSIFTPTITFTATPDTRPTPRNWSAWPIVPPVTQHVIDLYLKGVQLGVTPRTFTVVGDCQSASNVFMGIYGTDRNPIGQNNPDLLATINDFKDSFQHTSAAVRDGLSAPSALDPLWADPQKCGSGESPVACELRLYKPMIVFVNLGTNWKPGASADVYEGYLRQIVDLIIAAGAVPVLTNKADNVEGDHSINLATAKVAYDYDIPMVNFWLAADSLPNHGLDPSHEGKVDVYLTPAGWDVRNYVALQTLDELWRAMKTAYNPGP
ncbi:MAG TPA: SGNH/GDSL hydrolase family protein [Anaerolineales bacterium]|nr:SGNH/GDSL hydrolase family protein [Anaerolineales bacterium]